MALSSAEKDIQRARNGVSTHTRVASGLGPEWVPPPARRRRAGGRGVSKHARETWLPCWHASCLVRICDTLSHGVAQRGVIQCSCDGGRRSLHRPEAPARFPLQPQEKTMSKKKHAPVEIVELEVPAVELPTLADLPEIDAEVAEDI